MGGHVANTECATESDGMRAPELLCAAILAKTHEQIERTCHLIELLPADRLEWAPSIPGSWTVGLLLGHMLECLAGFCAVLQRIEPERLAHFRDLRSLPVNHRCAPSEA